MNRLLFFLMALTSFAVTGAEVVQENMDDAFSYSHQKPVQAERKLAGEDKKDKKRNVASDEIATESEVKYWKFKP